ncbi:MAG: hypothetical protein ACRC2T_10310 [Thermoguttaceae bacterium]
MKNLRQNKHSSNRSNAWSESKSSNRTKFDPYQSEWALVRADRNPTATITISEELKIDVYVRPLRDTFVRPFTVNDLEKTFKSVPMKFLHGLERIILFGGTKKQELTAGRMFRDGMYYPTELGGMIVLYPFLEKRMNWNCSCYSPHEIQEFRWAGAKIVPYKSGSFAQFDEESLKKYYLNIVLIHEIGHHVNWMKNKHDSKSKLTEEFADCFVGEYGIGGLHE